MKTKLSLLFIAILAMSIYSCKKEEENTPTEASALFFTIYADSTIGKVDLKNGNTISNFAKGASSGFSSGEHIGLALNPQTGDIYCTLEATNGPIYKVNASGVATVLFSGPEADEPAGVTYNSTNNRVYWLNRDDGRIYSISASGGTPSALYGGADVEADGYSIKLDEKNGKLYYANFSEIMVGNLDGTGTPSILYDRINDTLEGPSSIVLDVDKNKIYWTDENADVVASANLDGSGNIKILFNNATHGVDRSDGLAIDFVSKKVYWTETNSDRIRVGNLDGTGTPVTLVSDVESYGLLLK